MKIEHGGNLFAICAARGWDWREVIDFSASINPLGPAPAVRRAICSALDRIVHYPEQSPARLSARLAELWGVDPDQILLGNGATELLHFYARVQPQSRVTLPVPTFSEFHRAWPDAELVPWDQPEEWPDTGLLVYTQPNNPFGSPSPRVLRRGQPLLIDESFLEFTQMASVGPLVEDYPELLVLRSLTKFYALPGLRVGALIGSRKTIAALRKRREPWQVNVLAEAAALAAIEDRSHAEETLAFLHEERNRLYKRLCSLSRLLPHPSCANYIFAWVDGNASDLCGWLLERKILVRNCTTTPGVNGESIRFAIRTPAENDRLLELMEEYFCGH